MLNRNFIPMFDPYWAAIWLRLSFNDGPVPGVDPMGPLLDAALSAQLLKQIGHFSINERHKEALGNIANEMLTEAAKNVVQ